MENAGFAGGLFITVSQNCNSGGLGRIDSKDQRKNKGISRKKPETPSPRRKP